MKTLDFAGSKEKVYERSDYPPSKLQKMFKDETFAVIGYGTQGRAQALNMKDNGMRVVVGLREDGVSWKKVKIMLRSMVVLNITGNSGWMGEGKELE